MDESTVKDSEALLMAYVRYVDNREFIEDMLFCEALETTTIANDIYKKLKTYLDDKQIPMENIILCAADGAPVMMGKKWDFKNIERRQSPNVVSALSYS